MKTIIELISNEVMTAFKEAGYDENMGKVTLSNRPDLCEISVMVLWQVQKYIIKPRS